MGSHSKPAPTRQQREYRQGDRVADMVDASDHRVHVLTLEALSAGRRPDTPYLALCGQPMIPTSLTVPGETRCNGCRQQIIPAQRGHSRRQQRRRWWEWWRR